MNRTNPSRPGWIPVAFWTILAAALILILASLSGCGGGIDTPDEQMGPPETARVDPPRPCPIDVSACHPKPYPG